MIKRPPFKIQEEGWGEFDMRIIVSAIDKGGDHELLHDLNFQKERYEAEHKIVSTTVRTAAMNDSQIDVLHAVLDF